MSDLYLLAAGLLASGPISVPPPPLPPNWLTDLQNLASTRAARATTVMAETVAVPTVESREPEFSARSRPTPAAALPPIDPVPFSGSQLYQQRLAALKAGKLYTRLRPGSFYDRWGRATAQPTHQQWQKLLAREAGAIAKGQGNNRLNILVGDSLSLWFPSEYLPGGKFWLNQGISGENSGQVLKRLGAFQQTRPDTIYVMAGINDLRQGKSDRAILNNIRAIARRLRQTHPQAEVVVQSILPTRAPNLSNDRIRNLNRQIILIAQQEGASYLNLHALFADESGHMRSELTTDGLHLNRQGYAVWQSAIQQTEDWMAWNRP